MPRKPKPTRPRLNRVSVRGELHDEPDWDRFAYAALRYARLLSRQRQANERTDTEPLE